MKKFFLLAVPTMLSFSLVAQNVGIGTNAPTSKLDIAGGLSLREGAALTLANGNNDNIALAGNYSFYRITGPTGAFSILGIVPALNADGQVLTLVNTTSQVMTIKNNASGTAAQSIKTLTGSDIASVAGSSSVTLRYNKTEQRWYVTGSQNFAVSAANISTKDIVPGTGSAVTVVNGGNQVVGGGNVVLDVTTNALNQKGIVPAPTNLQGSMGYVTDGSGNPSWAKVPNANLANSSVTVNTGAGLSGGGNVALGGTLNLVNTGDLSNTNEAQTLSGSGTSNINLTQAGGSGGGTITLQGSGATSVSRSGNTFTISSTDNNSGGTVTNVATGAGLTGGPITGTGTISMANVGTAGTYTKVTTNARGQVTSGTTLSAGDIPDLSGTYIKNQTAQQAGANFNIAGNGTVAGTLNTSNVNTDNGDLNLSGGGWGMNFFIDVDNNSSNNYIFNGNGSEIMRLTDDGKLGIGSASPNSMVDIESTNTTAYTFSHNDANAYTPYPQELAIRNLAGNSANSFVGIYLEPGQDGGGLGISAARIGAVRTGSYTADLVFGNRRAGGFNENMRITSDGNVGIGTTSPSFKLHVVGGAIATDNYFYNSTTGIGQVVLNSSGSYYGNIANPAAQVWSLGYSSGGTAIGTPVLAWTSGGRVGIGTTAPSTNLDVNGSVRIRGGGPSAGEVLTATDANGNATWQKTESFTSADAQTGGTGWKRIAHIDGAAGRGYGKITVYTTGGSYTPEMTTIDWFHDWSTSAGLKISKQSPGAYWNAVRITDDGTNSYIEVNFTSDVSSLSLLSDNYGYQKATLYSGALPAGSGNVRATATVGRFNVGENDFYVGDNGNVGIGTASPASTLDISSTSSSPMYLRSSSGESDIDYEVTSGGWQVGTNANGNGTDNNQFYIYGNGGLGYVATFQKGTGNVGIGLTTPTKKLDVNGDIFNRGILYQSASSGQGSGAHGISWYNPSYVTWYDYMSPAGGTNAPNGTAAPSDATSGVTSWARRFNIENAGGYGWIFESGPNNSTQPTVKFSINSNNGNFHATGDGNVGGAMTVGSLSGTGSRLVYADANGKLNTNSAPYAQGLLYGSFYMGDFGGNCGNSTLNSPSGVITSVTCLGASSSDAEFRVNISPSITSYVPFITVRSNTSAAWNNNNDQIYSVGNITSSSFDLYMREVSGNGQTIWIDVMLMVKSY